jgi:hypothetical protein
VKTAVVAAGAVLLAAASFALGQETGKDLVATYDAVAVTILGAKKAEAGIVRAIVVDHRDRSRRAFEAKDWTGAAAEMALFANEGDNAVGGIRKRLLEGGHHHHAAEEQKGIYEEGYVIVTRAAKKECLDASMDLQKAADDAGRAAAWKRFAAAAASVLK